MAEDKEKLLDLLNSYGNQFMSSFDSSIFSGKRKDAPEAGPSSSRKKAKVEEPTSPEVDSEEEWSGLGVSDSEVSEDEGYVEVSDDEAGERQGSSGPAVIVFSEKGKSTTVPPMGSKAQLKAFMSSKVTKVTKDPIPTTSKQRQDSDDEDDETTNAQNDALLHQLVHTKILSGSLNPDLELTPAQRKKALAGRVLEAAGQAKLGRGETAVRAKERNKAAKHIRDGLVAKQKERTKKELEEAKHMGNYHPMLKQLYDSSLENKPKKKRERGLKMGVGQFSGGVLKLSRAEIASASGQTQRGPQRKGGRGGKSGRGGRRKP